MFLDTGPFTGKLISLKKDLMSFSAIYMRNFVCSALRLGGSGVYRRQELPSFNFSSKTFYMTPHIIFCGCFISHFVYKHSVVMVIKEDSLTTPGLCRLLVKVSLSSVLTVNLNFQTFILFCILLLRSSGGKWQIKRNLLTFDLVWPNVVKLERLIFYFKYESVIKFKIHLKQISTFTIGKLCWIVNFIFG